MERGGIMDGTVGDCIPMMHPTVSCMGSLEGSQTKGLSPGILSSVNTS